MVLGGCNLDAEVMKTNDPIHKLADTIHRAQRIVALTGAGISVDSGIPAFRGGQGLWSTYDPMEYAHIDAFLRAPEKVWRMLSELDRLVADAKPNQAHYALARLETVSSFSSVITQNIDNLHQDAGSSKVIEFHGNGRRMRCLKCGAVYQREQIDLNFLPPRCSCSGLIKPDIVFFGEEIPWNASLEANAEASNCDVILVIGTSAVVAPASSIPYLARDNGATVVEINPEPTQLTGFIADISIHRGASAVLSDVLRILEG